MHYEQQQSEVSDSGLGIEHSPSSTVVEELGRVVCQSCGQRLPIVVRPTAVESPGPVGAKPGAEVAAKPREASGVNPRAEIAVVSRRRRSQAKGVNLTSWPETIEGAIRYGEARQAERVIALVESVLAEPPTN